MESMWNDHGIHMESMDYFYSIWNQTYSTWNPYGFHGIFTFHMDSIWIPYGIWGQGKLLAIALHGMYESFLFYFIINKNSIILIFF